MTKRCIDAIFGIHGWQSCHRWKNSRTISFGGRETSLKSLFYDTYCEHFPNHIYLLMSSAFLQSNPLLEAFWQCKNSSK